MSRAFQNFLASICFLLGPIAVFGIYKLHRHARGVQQAERDALPYNPRPEPKPGFLLRRFSAPEQKYLRQLFGTDRNSFLILGWLTFGIFSLPISDTIFDTQLFTHNPWNNPSVFLWFRILLAFTSLTQTTCVLVGMSLAAFMASNRFGNTARFFRTRPLGIGFLFWTNLVTGLGAVLAAIFTGIGASLLLLTMIHGPIWRHLPPAFPGVVTANDDKPKLYASLLASSGPRILLSIGTTTALSLSLFAALLAIPYSWRGQAKRRLSGSRPGPRNVRLAGSSFTRCEPATLALCVIHS